MIAKLERLARLAVFSAIILGSAAGSLIAAYRVGYSHGFDDGAELKRKSEVFFPR
jgi:hypothetical protein